MLGKCRDKNSGIEILIEVDTKTVKCVTCFCASLISARAGPSVTIMSSQQSAKQGEAVSSQLKQRVAFISGKAAEKQDHGSNENA
jgi:hypothetical protein